MNEEDVLALMQALEHCAANGIPRVLTPEEAALLLALSRAANSLVELAPIPTIDAGQGETTTLVEFTDSELRAIAAALLVAQHYETSQLALIASAELLEEHERLAGHGRTALQTVVGILSRAGERLPEDPS